MNPYKMILNGYLKRQYQAEDLDLFVKARQITDKQKEEMIAQRKQPPIPPEAEPEAEK